MSDLLSEPLSLPLLERHRTPPSGKEILERFVERYALRPLGDRAGGAPSAPASEPAMAEAPEEPTVLFTLPVTQDVPVEASPAAADDVAEETTRVLEVPPETEGEGIGTPTMAFETVSGEPAEEATRVLEVPPESEGEGIGTPTMAFETVSGEPAEEATRVLEVPPESEGDDEPDGDASGTPTVAMVAGEPPKKRKKRRHR